MWEGLHVMPIVENGGTTRGIAICGCGSHAEWSLFYGLTDKAGCIEAVLCGQCGAMYVLLSPPSQPLSGGSTP